MDVFQLLKKLVSFPVLGGESNLTIIYWIQQYIENFGVQTTLVPNKVGNKASLHCRIGPPVNGGVILSGHSDVVPVAGQNWDTDPFELIDKGDGNLYGRGSCDMKGFIACCLAVLPELVKATLKKPIYFAFSYDEEVGCLGAPDLIKHIQDTYTEKPKYAIIGEPTLMDSIVGQKGIYILDINVNGSAGHSSRILDEVSAVHEAARLVLWLENKMHQLVKGGTKDDRFYPPFSTLHVGQIKGGIASNVIADKAYFSLDIRTIPEDNLEVIVEEFKAHCKSQEQKLRAIFPDFKIDIKENHPPVPPLNTPAGTSVIDLIQKITGNTEQSGVSYASEAGQFANGGYESIICGPGSIAQAHRANEFIAKDQLEKGIIMLQNLINEMAGPN